VFIEGGAHREQATVTLMGIDYVGVVDHEAAQLAAVARQGPLDAPVPACPGWDLGRLVGHLGRVHRWATLAVTTGSEPDQSTLERPPRGPEVVEWYEAGIAPLVSALRGASPPGRWNFMSAPDPDATFWRRRQAIETSIHRWDGEDAVGGASDASPLQASLASDGIDEHLFRWSPWNLAGKDGIDIGGSVHLHCTDVDGEWTFQTDDGLLRVDRGHAKGDAALRGPASSLLLVLWRRVRPGEGGSEVLGDAAVLDRWLALGA
jgi:uncharacterized protein (TIGR03083 family)